MRSTGTGSSGRTGGVLRRYAGACRRLGDGRPTIDTTFASSTVPRHLLRGAVGLTLLVAALALVPVVGPLSLLLILPAGLALRGCPTCWALGLAQTLAMRRERDCSCASGPAAAVPTDLAAPVEPAAAVSRR